MSSQASRSPLRLARRRGGGLGEIDVRAVVFRSLIVLLIVVGAITVDGFATTNNLKAFLASIAFVGIAAVGMSMITIGGNLVTLSLGATVATSTVLFATLTDSFPVAVAIVLALAAAGLAGALQGIVVARFRGDPIVTTIAGAALLLGVGQLIASGRTVGAEGDLSFLRGHVFGFLPFGAACFIALAVAGQWMLSRTRFGAWVRLTGENREAARLAGVPVPRVITLTYTIAGTCAAIIAVLLVGQSGQGTLELGVGTDFDAIAAILVGGVAITGGRGTITDVALGAVFLGLVVNLLAVSGQSYDVQLLVKGAIVLVAVAIAGLGARMRGAEG